MPNQSAVLNSVFHALADPTRRSVLERLGKGPAPVSELAQGFDMALPSFLQHLGVLDACGLVLSEKAGRVRTYRLAEPLPFKVAEQWMGSQRVVWERRLNQLDSYLIKLKEKKP
ncbi:MAG: transcriptional regulator [Fibrobacteres bacterium]|nr:transcriptional regulator [Fibrobacterota bacterium]